MCLYFIMNCIYKIEAQNHKQENFKLKSENGHLKFQFVIFQKCFNDLLSVNPTYKPAIKTIFGNVLEATGKISPPQINMLYKQASGVQNPRCRDWAYQDFSKAIELRAFSKNSLPFVRNICGLPLPANSTLDKKFKFMKITPGPIRSVILYLKDKVCRMPFIKRLCSITFDETRYGFKLILIK